MAEKLDVTGKRGKDDKSYALYKNVDPGLLLEIKKERSPGATFTGDQQYPWESQTMLIASLGTAASLAASLGWVQLTAEQISSLGLLLFPLIAALRKWSGGEKIVLKK